ncbi:MAG: stage 0 sporulation family protein [Candidatus Pelethousia sp.]|nr:stage 0 sporulation family protein [Candidatus Pelethousia sp.]
MKTVIGVKFRGGSKVYYFDPGELPVQEGDGVIVETARGVEFGDVVNGPHEVEENQIFAPLKAVERIATQKDHEMRAQNAATEKDAFTTCMEKIQARGLDMKLVDVEYSFNGSKVVFYFTADGRVDFRELVKDLASVLKTRIELRQIGVRDEAKMLGGLGSCGRPVCCKTFLADFQPVSIKMAKEQNLSLSPTKISGICGRLMCCLKYEQDCYESMRKMMPKVGKDVTTPEGMTGMAVENNVLTEKTKVKLLLPDGSIDIREYPFRELGYRSRPAQAQQPREADESVDMPAEYLEQAEAESAPAPTQAEQPAEEKPEEDKRPTRSNRSRRRRSGSNRPRPNGEAAPQSPRAPQA